MKELDTMNAKTGIAVVALVLLWASVGGCPAPTDGSDDPTDTGGSTPADTSGDAGAGDSTGGDDGSTDDGSSSDGGASDGADDGGTDTGSGDDSSSDDGTDGTGDSGGDDPGSGDPNDHDVTPLFAGTFSGTVTYVKSESLGGPLGLEEQWTADRTMTFGADGLPTAFVIPGYGQTEGGIEFVAEVNEAGETVTLTETSGTYTATLTVTVALATYHQTTANVVLSLEHHGEMGSLVENGTGIQVIEYELDSGNVVYHSLTNYEVNLSDLVDTLWQVDCRGTLYPE
jgi:hypothetical protein